MLDDKNVEIRYRIFFLTSKYYTFHCLEPRILFLTSYSAIFKLNHDCQLFMVHGRVVHTLLIVKWCHLVSKSETNLLTGYDPYKIIGCCANYQ